MSCTILLPGLLFLTLPRGHKIAICDTTSRLETGFCALTCGALSAQSRLLLQMHMKTSDLVSIPETSSFFSQARGRASQRHADGGDNRARGWGRNRVWCAQGPPAARSPLPTPTHSHSGLFSSLLPALLCQRLVLPERELIAFCQLPHSLKRTGAPALQAARGQGASSYCRNIAVFSKNI